MAHPPITITAHPSILVTAHPPILVMAHPLILVTAHPLLKKAHPRVIMALPRPATMAHLKPQPLPREIMARPVRIMAHLSQIILLLKELEGPENKIQGGLTSSPEDPEGALMETAGTTTTTATTTTGTTTIETTTGTTGAITDETKPQVCQFNQFR
jgi:hypothetical protein